MEWFTRRHAVVLARSSPSRLKYLEKTGIIIPHRPGLSPKSEVLYSWEQILEIRAIARLRQYLSFQAIRKIIQYFEDHGFEPSLRDKHIVVKDGQVTWVQPSSSLVPQVIQLCIKGDRQVGQLVLAPLEQKETTEADLKPLPLAGKVVDLQAFKQGLRSPR
jgi:DNA-binding transcriptional MerR regulator